MTKLTDEQFEALKQDAKAIYEEGYTISSVAAKLGVTYGTARRLVTADGYELRPRGTRGKPLEVETADTTEPVEAAQA